MENNELQDFINCFEKETEKYIIIILEEFFKKIIEGSKKEEDKKNDSINDN